MPVEIIRDIIPRSLCRAAEAAWPSPEWPYWHRYQGKTADKFGSMDRARIPPSCIAALDALAQAVVPYIGESFIDYDLHAAGMHMMAPGGFLARHLDAECHPIRPWRRTHSIVMSVCSEWRVEFGGQLWIEDGPMIVPEIAQAVIFDTPGTWHEVFPVRHGVGVYRKTLALFAWTIDTDCVGDNAARFSERAESR